MVTSLDFFRLSVVWVAVVMAVCALMLMTKTQPAEAAFPGKNGKIAFTRESGRDSHIFTINADGSGLTKISTRPRHDGDPSWSPNGKKIAFSGLMNGNWDIYVVNADGRGLKRVTKSRAGDFSPSWSPDGKRLAFVRQSAEGGRNTICESCVYTIKVDGKGLKRLTATRRFASDPAWSPNGKKIAYSQFVRRSGGQIFKMNSADGSKKRNLTNSRFQESAPNWSPDGKKIAYTSFTESRGAFDRVFTMNADGSDQRNLTRREGGWSPAWSPDGTKIVFASTHPNRPTFNLYVMKADGTEAKRLTKSQAHDWSPDWQALPNVKSRVTKCSQKQAAAARQVQRGDARADRRRSSAALISQKRKIHQKQVNACRHGKATGSNIRLRPTSAIKTVEPVYGSRSARGSHERLGQ